MHSDAPRLVVGAIIVDDLASPTTVLAARRTSPAELAGMWEFPGGKVEQGETPTRALIREIREELDATIAVGSEVPHACGAWPISEKYELRLYLAEVVDGTLTPGDSHDELRWLPPSELSGVRWLPSDAGALAAIQSLLVRWPG